MEPQARVDRTERIARNQSLFREVNEQLESLASSFQFVSEHAIFVCECADLDCVAQVEITMGEYEAVRARGNTFVVLPDHVEPEVERIETANERYAVVAKFGDAMRIAKAADPRAR